MGVVTVGADPKEGRGRGVVSSASYEAYLDLSGRVEDLDQAANLARTIMQEVLDREDLSCSVGVAPNKMLAKIGSDFRKPYGLTVISEKGAKEFLSPLGVRKIPGVGPRTEEILLDLDIRTIGQLAAADPDRLARQLGILGKRLYERAQGIDPSEVVVNYETKSIGREVTFERDIKDAAPILQMMDGLAEEIHGELIECGFRFKTITVKVRYEHFDTFTRARSLSFSTNDLDIPTLSCLEDYLDSFGGCLLVSSHDRYFLDRTTESLLCYEGSPAPRVFTGSYTDYLASLASRGIP